MKIEFLKEFVAIGKYLNFSTASKELYIAQPVLSRHLSALEEELGVRLLERSTMSVKFTKAGEYFYDEITSLLRNYDNICAATLLKDTSVAHGLRIGIAYYSMNDYLGSAPYLFTEKYFDKYPLRYLASEPKECVSNLLAGETDIAITSASAFENIKNVIVHNVFREPIIALLNEKHPLAKKPFIMLSELKEYEFCAIKSTNPSHSFSDNWISFVNICKEYGGFVPKVAQTFDQFESALIHIRQNANIMYISGRHRYNSNINSLTSVPIIGNKCWRDIAITYRADNSNPAIEKFISIYNSCNTYGWPETYIGVENSLDSVSNKK